MDFVCNFKLTSKEIIRQKVFVTHKVDFYIISESNYDKTANAREVGDKIKLNSNNKAVVFVLITNFTSEYNYNGKTITIRENSQQFSLKVVSFKNYSLPNSSMMRYDIVVTDEIYNKYHTKDNNYRMKGYITENKKDSEGITNELTSLLSRQLQQNNGGGSTFSSKYAESNEFLCICLGGLVRIRSTFSKTS